MNLRLIVLILSVSSIVGFGYALGGLGSYILAGKLDMLYIGGGLLLGFAAAAAALILWKKFLLEMEEE